MRSSTDESIGITLSEAQSADRMREAPLGMLVTYTHITPRDECPIRKVMSESKTERNCNKWFQNLCNLANRLSRALDLPLDPPYRVWASFNPPTDKRKIILRECTVSNGGRRDGRKLPKMLARAHAKFSCKVA